MMPFLVRSLVATGALAMVVLPACKPKEKPDKKKAKAEMAEAGYIEREAILKFAKAIRETFEWKSSQVAPASEAAQRRILAEMSARMRAVPVKNLPADLSEPWARMLVACGKLAESANLDQADRIQGEQAAAELNRALRARGILDLHF